MSRKDYTDEILAFLQERKNTGIPYRKEEIMEELNLTLDKYKNDPALYDLSCSDFDFALYKLLQNGKIIQKIIDKTTYYMAS